MFKIWNGGPSGRAVLIWVIVGPAIMTGPARASQSGLEAISGDSLVSDVRWLADDAREGRMTGSPGCEASAEWIAGHFRRYGLEPGGDQGTYFQTFSADVGVGFGSDNAFVLTGVPGLESVAMDKDFRPLVSSENGSKAGQLVFAGYGLTVPNLNYDDYAGVDVSGKYVIVLRHQPMQADTSSAFSKLDPATYVSIRAKLKNAKNHGALGMIFVTGPGSPEADKDNLLAPRWREAMGGAGILAVHVKRHIAEQMLSASGVDLNKWVTDVDKTQKPASVVLTEKIEAKVSVEVKKEERQTANVIGILRGTDPSAKAIVLGAHYDHLGRGNESSLAPSQMGQIHNGADDNASGTSGLIELARVLSAEPRLKRTLIFAAFSGEEVGLLGSKFMVEHPPVPLDQIDAMLNMDMIGRPKGGKVLVGGVGTSPGFGALLEHAGQGRALKIEASKGVESASDHEEFYQKGVPVLFFFSGLHEDYHKPSDDWDKIDKNGIADITKIVWSATTELGGGNEDLAFMKAVETKDPHSSGTGGGFGAYFGSIPDYGAQEHGVKLAGVKDGSPAAAAGVKEGDIIIKFAGREIADIYDYTDAIKGRRPGDVVDVVVMRAGKEVTLKAKLASRD
jgi:peptidase M28-like protein/PDZ domain-containing protein